MCCGSYNMVTYDKGGKFMLFNFYDIESLSNVFTVANYIPYDNHIDIYYLVDDPETVLSSGDLKTELTDRIHARNKNFTGTVSIYDMSKTAGAEALAKVFGASDLEYRSSDPNVKDSLKNKFRIVYDTDDEYDPEKHPFFMGYNSFNYDTTMLAMFFYLCFYRKGVHGDDAIPTAGYMRRFNNLLFEQYKDRMPDGLKHSKSGKPNRFAVPVRIRKNMLLTGRHLDVARLNEKQSKVGLKRLLGTLGYQILESDKLRTNADHIDSLDEFCELVAYNASDVINLELLFKNDLYQAQFSLKRGLLGTYPQLIYNPKKDKDGKETYEADIRPGAVRDDRLVIDSSSAQFATKCLCPYGHLSDLKTVSYMYPSEQKAKELGIKRVNVLEETKKFFYANFSQPEIRAQFDEIYKYYKSIEGKNFNSSMNYIDDFGAMAGIAKITEIPKPDCCIPYYYKDGTPSSCYALFSIGGIHGAEYNKALYDADVKEYMRLVEDLEYVKSVFPNPKDLRKAKEIEMPNGKILKAENFLKSSKAEYRTYRKPELFVAAKNGGTELNKKYVYTSCVDTNHEDFTSYYPNMLRMMSAFWNPGLGYDRYAEIFDNKQKYGKLMKDKSIPEHERSMYAVLREGTKLILNSASGAADTNFGSPIQMNNRIISMRVIGQLFSYRIGQAQTLAGAKIVSTNTDGLYSADIDDELNNMILARESADIGVAIEPEPMFLVSKDANNRMEIGRDRKTLFSASGGSLACHKGPNPAKSLAHPAIIDWAMVQYLFRCARGESAHIDAPFNYDVGEEILMSAYDEFVKKDPENAGIHWLNMFQTMIASSPGTNMFVFGKTSLDENGEIVLLSHYNRVFIMDDTVENMHTLHLQGAYLPKVNAETWKKRQEDPAFSKSKSFSLVDPDAYKVLKANGVDPSKFEQCDVAIRKITGIDREKKVYVMNRSLHELTADEIGDIRNNIDWDSYIEMMASTFENSWRNLSEKYIQRFKYVEASDNSKQISLF